MKTADLAFNDGDVDLEDTHLCREGCKTSTTTTTACTIVPLQDFVLDSVDESRIRGILM